MPDWSSQNELLQNLPKALFGQFYRYLIKLRITGESLFPKQKALIIAINHKTGVDPIAILATFKRRIFFAVDGGWFNNWFGRFFYGKLCDGIPVYNKQGAENLAGIKRCLELLKQGFIVGFFPEGTLVRNKPVGEIRSGAAYLSLKSGAPIVPVYIKAQIMGPYPGEEIGSASIYEGVISVFGNLFHKITVAIGEPIFPQEIINQIGSPTVQQSEFNELVIKKIKQKIYEQLLELAKRMNN